jgi:uncharacterized membrane protein (UPF0127 family)
MIQKELKEFFLKHGIKIILATIFLVTFISYSVPIYSNLFSLYADKSSSIDQEVSLSKKNIRVGKVSLDVDIADTDTKRMQGLSGRKDLKEGTGMLFIFDKLEVNDFWMKDMNFDIDIIWFNEQGELIYVEEYATPASYPELLGPKEESKYVLEVPAGFFKKEGLKLGDKIDLY